MNPELYRLMMEIDKADQELDEYFTWSEEEKQNITNDIIKLLEPFINQDKFLRESLAFSIMTCIQKAIETEEYEQADIMDRCLKELQKKM